MEETTEPTLSDEEQAELAALRELCLKDNGEPLAKAKKSDLARMAELEAKAMAEAPAADGDVIPPVDGEEGDTPVTPLTPAEQAELTALQARCSGTCGYPMPQEMRRLGKLRNRQAVCGS